MMQKKNLIILHGALGSSKSFDALVPHLNSQFNLIVPDFKWHGSKTETGSSFHMQDLANDLEDILKKESIDSTAVFGYSMGGYVALALALKKPEYFDKIMTLGTKLDWKPEQAEKESKMLNPEKIQEKVPKFAQHLKNIHDDNWADLCKQTAEMMLDLGQHPILTTDNISTIDLPIRLGLADQDHMVSLSETVAFYKSLTHGQLQVFPNCPHPIEKIKAVQLSNAIIDFVG